MFPNDPGMRAGNEIANRSRMPVIAACETCGVIHALLHDSPFTVRGQNERVYIKLKPITDRIVINARSQTARPNERIAIEPFTAGQCTQFIRCSARVLATASAEVDAEFIATVGKASFERTK